MFKLSAEVVRISFAAERLRRFVSASSTAFLSGR